MKTVLRIVDRKLPIELYWIDAEWFGHGRWQENVGNWTIRKDLHPQGFRPLSDGLHGAGRKFLLWLEPQRVCQGTEWAKLKDRPGWLLEHGPGPPKPGWDAPYGTPAKGLWESRRSELRPNDLLWNLRDPAARTYLTDWLSARIEEFGLDWYREDANMAPLEFWRHADAPERQGMTEIRYIEGLYAVWDELLARHTNLAIDNCASGGRRIDIETLGRSTPLWRTDWPFDLIDTGLQVHLAEQPDSALIRYRRVSRQGGWHSRPHFGDPPVIGRSFLTTSSAKGER